MSWSQTYVKYVALPSFCLPRCGVCWRTSCTLSLAHTHKHKPTFSHAPADCRLLPMVTHATSLLPVRDDLAELVLSLIQLAEHVQNEPHAVEQHMQSSLHVFKQLARVAEAIPSLVQQLQDVGWAGAGTQSCCALPAVRGALRCAAFFSHWNVPCGCRSRPTRAPVPRFNPADNICASQLHQPRFLPPFPRIASSPTRSEGWVRRGAHQ